MYGNTGAIPFELAFAANDKGGVNLTVISPLGQDVFAIPANALSGLSHLTDTSACYVSFSPWATQSTMSVEVTAIHTEDKAADIPTEPDVSGGAENEEPEHKMNFFEAIAAFFAAIFKGIGEFFAELFGA